MAFSLLQREMQGPCEVLSSRSCDRVLYWVFVMLERRAVQVACAVLRGQGGGDTALLPGGANGAEERTKRQPDTLRSRETEL